MNLGSYRAQFPILEHKAHLGNCSQSPQSSTLLASMNEYLENWATRGMDWDYWVAGVERAKAAFAALIHADQDEIAVVACLSDAVNVVASALPTEGKGHVVTTTAEFPTVGHAWLGHQESGPLQVSYAHTDDGFYGPDDFAPLMRNDTAILSVHHVGYYNGAKQDIAQLTEFAHQHGARIFVDAYQSAGTVEIDVKKTGIDMLASGNLKYLLGLPGVAFLYVRRELAESLQPAMTGWFGRINPFHFDATLLDYAPAAGRFNTGTPPILAAFAVRGGMELLYEVGVDRIQKRIEELSAYAIAGIKARSLELASPADVHRKGATTAIRVGDSHDVEQFLADRDVIASARADVIRIAPHFFTEEREIDLALDGIVDWKRQA